MPMASKRVRKARRAVQVSKETQIRRLTQANSKLQQLLINLAIKLEDKAAKSDRLAKLLGAVIAVEHEGLIAIEQRHFDGIPEGIMVIESYEPATDQIIIRTAVPKEQPAEISDPKPEGDDVLVGVKDPIMILDEDDGDFRDRRDEYEITNDPATPETNA